MCNSVDISQIICHKMLHAIWVRPFLPLLHPFFRSLSLFFAYDDDDQKRSLTIVTILLENGAKFHRMGVWHSLAYTNSQNFIMKIFVKRGRLQKCKANKIYVMRTLWPFWSVCVCFRIVCQIFKVWILELFAIFQLKFSLLHP